jgi:serine/threonine protein kinase/WD40 repeat protein
VDFLALLGESSAFEGSQMSRSPEKKDAKAIFSAAVEYYLPHQWEAYIADACGDDEALRYRVRELLNAHQQSDSLLDRDQESGVTAGTPVTERPGTQIGPYKLLQEIGEGGFGVVYMAEQVEPVRRKVALKIIKPGMDTKQVIARFEAERQALAMMDHPSIAKVLDAGSTDSGRPYFVMELVKGVPITEFCDANRLSNRERLELFTTVCRAIQHAHQKGVIHRDLKPSNVMVTLHDNKPMPVVIDFGVSKAISHQLTEKTLFTAYGQMVGTPAYMSPEQAQMSRMDIDTRSDIYSLGVLLYELLTGGTPLSAEELRGTAYAELQRKIREEEAPKPSTRLSTLGKAASKIAQDRNTDPKRLGQFLRGDLDWIVLKSLEKERSRRYETANGLASDIERFLNDEAVEACPPSVTYQMRKFVGRNRGLVTTASAIAAAVLLGIVGTTYGMIRARSDARRATAALEEAAIARDLAKTAAQQEAEKAEEARRLQRDADQLREDAEAQVAQQLAMRAGMERVKGDVTLAALLDAEALARDQGDPVREANHRRRLAADLMQCPRPTHLLFHNSRVTDARYSHNGRWIATACDDGSVRVWDAVTGEQKQQLNHDGPITQVLFVSGDANLLVVETLPVDSPEDPAARQHLWQWRNGDLLGSSDSHAPDPITYRDLEKRTTYIERRAVNEVQVRSVIDGASVGPVMKSERGELDRVYSNGNMRAILLTSRSSASVRRRGSSFPQRGENGGGPGLFPGMRNDYFAELWDAESGVSDLLFESTPIGFASSITRDPRFRDKLFAPCYSDDQSVLAVRMGRDGGIGVLDADTGEVIQSVAEGTNLLPHQFNPDHSLLACIDFDEQEVELVDVATGEVSSWGIPVGTDFQCAFGSQRSGILIVNKQGDPQLWNARSGKAAAPPMNHESEVQEVGYSPDGRYLRVVCVDGSVRIWDGVTGEPASPLLKHIGTVTQSTFSRDGSHLLVAAGDIVWLWPIGWPKFRQLSISLGEASTTGPPIPNNSAVMSPDGTRIFTRRVLNVDGGSSFALGRAKVELSVRDSSTGQRTHGPVVSELKSRALLLSLGGLPGFDTRGDRILMNETSPLVWRGQVGRSREPATEDERATEQTLARIWNLRNGELMPLKAALELPGAFLQDTGFSNDGRRVFGVICYPSPRRTRGEAGSGVTDAVNDSHVIVWDSDTGNLIGRVLNFDWQIQAHGFSPDGRHFAYADGNSSDQRQVQVIDIDDGSPVGPPIECEDSVVQVSFCRDGQRLLTVTRSGVASMWKTSTLELEVGPIAMSLAHPQPRVVLSPSTEVMALLADVRSQLQRRPLGIRLFPSRALPAFIQQSTLPTVVLYRPGSNTKTVLQHDRGVVDVSFSPDSQYLLTTSLDGGVRVWDVASGQLMRTLRPTLETGTLVDASFSGDGQRIVTRTREGARVWEVATGQPLSPILQGPQRRQMRGLLGGVSWNASADRFLIGTEDGLMVHDLSADQRNAAKLQRMTQVLSGRRVNSLGNIETLASAQLKTQWQASTEELSEGLISAPRGSQWHRLQLSDARNESRSVKIWHLSQLIASEPESEDWPAARGKLLAEQNRHSEAVDDFHRAIELGATGVRLDHANSLARLERWREVAQQLNQVLKNQSDEVPSVLRQRMPRGMTLTSSDAKLFGAVVVRYTLGLAYLMAEDQNAYEKCCERLLEEASRFERIPFYPTLLTLNLLTPRSVEYCDELEAKLPSRDSSIDARVSSRFNSGRFRASISALLDFRRGEFRAAVGTRRGSIAQSADEVAARMPGPQVSRSPFLTRLTAMVHYQQGDTDEARRLLDLASENGESVPRFAERVLGQSIGQAWCAEAIDQIIRREAEEMIFGGG